MQPRSQRLVPRARTWIVVASSTATLCLLWAASAASLGGLRSTDLLSTTKAQTVPTTTPPTTVPPGPTTITCDTFSLASNSGSDLDGRQVRPATCGTGVWTENRGDWSIQNGQLRTNDGSATASIAVGSSSVTAQVTALNLNGNNRAGGVAVSHSGASRMSIAGVVRNGTTAQIRLVNNTNFTVVASATVSPGGSTVLRLTRQGNTVTLRVNGVIVATYTLTAAQAATYTGTRAGLYQETGTPIRYTNFLVTTPSP